MAEIGAGGGVLLGPGVLAKEPEIAAAVMEVIGLASEIECSMGGLLAYMLGADSNPTLTLYNSLKSSNVQRSAILAIAKEEMDKRRLAIFTAICTFIQRPIEERNKFAHWNWGYSEKIRGALILINPSYRSVIENESFSFSSSIVKSIFDNDVKDKTYPDLDYTKMFICKIEDVLEVSGKLQKACGHLAVLKTSFAPMPKGTMQYESFTEQMLSIIENDSEISAVMKKRDNFRTRLAHGLPC